MKWQWHVILKLHVSSSLNASNTSWIVYVWSCWCTVIWSKVNYFWLLKGKILHFTMHHDKSGVLQIKQIWHWTKIRTKQIFNDYNTLNIIFFPKILWPSLLHINFCNASLFLENIISHAASNSFDVLLVNSRHSNCNYVSVLKRNYLIVLWGSPTLNSMYLTLFILKKMFWCNLHFETMKN